MVFGDVPSKNGNRCPRKSGPRKRGLSSLYDCLLCLPLLPFVWVETLPGGYLVGKELVILLFVFVVGKCFVIYYVFSFAPAVYVRTLNLIALIPGTSILTLKNTLTKFRVCNLLFFTTAIFLCCAAKN